MQRLSWDLPGNPGGLPWKAFEEQMQCAGLSTQWIPYFNSTPANLVLVQQHLELIMLFDIVEQHLLQASEAVRQRLLTSTGRRAPAELGD